ncbi:MAG TPA: hypothetical protein VM260_24445 [Pirellula sp.]|nr:hypothetical protein [Pirellula sp.]
MFRIRHTLLTIAFLAIFTTFAEVQAQIFFRPSVSTRVIPQNRATFGTQRRVYANNGVRYQSYRPSYGATRIYSNGSYVVQPDGSYIPSSPTYYAQPTTRYFYDDSNRNPVYSDNQVYSSFPSTGYSSNDGSGYYNSPQQAASANAGARIGNAIGGVQGAQIGEAIGSAIGP